MKEKISTVWTPVKREGAEDYLLLSLISFGASVVFTRLFLNLANFPKLGNDNLHIAHVLWGGLILFAAALLPLIFANKWAYSTSAIFSGLGVGLFIDEVGKFITQTNNYFFPPAAPIIYAFFLITVLIYMRVRKSKSQTPRSEMYRALSILTEVLDSDLDAEERTDINSSLQYVRENSDDPALVKLSQDLISFIESEHLVIYPRRTTLIGWKEKIRQYLEKVLPRPVHRSVIIGGLCLVSLLAIFDLVSLIMLSQKSIQPLNALIKLEPLVVSSATNFLWHLVRLTMEGVIGIIALVGAALILFKDEQRGVYISTISLLMQLLVVDLLVFYLDQFSAAISAIFQLILLLLLVNYRRRFLA